MLREIACAGVCLLNLTGCPDGHPTAYAKGSMVLAAYDPVTANDIGCILPSITVNGIELHLTNALVRAPLADSQEWIVEVQLFADAPGGRGKIGRWHATYDDVERAIRQGLGNGDTNSLSVRAVGFYGVAP